MIIVLVFVSFSFWRFKLLSVRRKAQVIYFFAMQQIFWLNQFFTCDLQFRPRSCCWCWQRIWSQSIKKKFWDSIFQHYWKEGDDNIQTWRLTRWSIADFIYFQIIYVRKDNIILFVENGNWMKNRTSFKQVFRSIWPLTAFNRFSI